MANPQLPIQQGGNLASLDRENEIDDALKQEDEIQHYEAALGLEDGEADEEVIELNEIKENRKDL